MDYKDIIADASDKLYGNNKWWPKCFFHFTDVHNAVGILIDGKILSRRDALAHGRMLSDNASNRVISNTDEETLKFARLYFRPRTPTQFHNEGYKPKLVRDQEINASCPVPVFILLDSAKVLELDDVYFVEKGMAGKAR